MRRTTTAELQAIVARINNYAGTPMEYSSNKGTEKFKANVGHYHLDSAYGGHKLVQTTNEGGGITEITYGFCTKRELSDKMHAFIRGMETSKK